MDNRASFAKAYICHIAPGKERDILTFSSKSHEAWHWDSRQNAEAAQAIYNRGVSINSALSGTYLITDFEIEEDAPDRFILVCEAPFAPHIPYESVSPLGW